MLCNQLLKTNWKRRKHASQRYFKMPAVCNTALESMCFECKRRCDTKQTFECKNGSPDQITLVARRCEPHINWTLPC